MNKNVVSIILTLMLSAFAVTAFSETSSESFEGLSVSWLENKDSPEFQKYLGEFIQWSNYYKLDSKNDCYAKSAGSVTLMLSVNKVGKIERVLSDVDNEKALCLQASYRGLNIKPPPYSPLVIQMTF
jgi:hypothetical protein